MTAPIIMWFRQDLRLADNAALLAASRAGPVVPLFVLDDHAAADWRWGSASRWWLHRSLEQLEQSLPLVLLRGETSQVLEEVIDKISPSALHFTRDYAPWSGALEQKIKVLCDRKEVSCHRHSGFLLHEPETIRNGSGQFFKVYTPFSNACMAKGMPLPPKPVAKPGFWRGTLAGEELADWALLPSRPDWTKPFTDIWKPGEIGARQRLAAFLDDGLEGYAEGRDVPSAHHFSRLSPHLHWGEISPRQVWYSIESAMAHAEGRLDRDGTKFLKEVLWREFSNHLLHHVPTLPREPFRTEFRDFPWREDETALRHWQRGETGYPIVDAGMRELWATGFMHNRVRMIVASFLIKHLLIHWRHGEAWFWDTLVDADIANNSASWQWVAGCGADASPYFRVFNPVLQGEKFDPRGLYVRQWVPELADVPDAFVHQPWTMAHPPEAYPAPIVEHGMARARALSAFKSLKN